MTQSYTVTDTSNESKTTCKDVGVRLLSNLPNSSLCDTIQCSSDSRNSSGSFKELIKDEKKTLEKIEIEKEERCKKCVHWSKVIWAFVGFLISVADVTVILYLAYLHFHHSQDIMAWLMLLPILLNFIGIFTFLSDDKERQEMESLACKNAIWKNLMFFPVLGPSVSALRLFYLSLREKNGEKFERLESLLTRMKQYESFFRAAPEAFVQLTFRIITWSRTREFRTEDYWVKLCLGLCLFALAESNMYSTVLPYYRMFHRDRTPDGWRIEHIPTRWRVALFFFNYLSIGSRIYSEGILKATACFYFHEYSFGEVLIITFLCQFVVRAGLYSFFVGFLGSKRQKKVLSDTGVYGAFTYSWKSLFMSFEFQSYCPSVFLSFYLENFILIVGSYIIIFTGTDVDLRDKFVFNVYAVMALICMAIAIGLRCFIRKRFEGIRCGNKVTSKE